MADDITIETTDNTTHGAYRAAVPGSDRQAELTWTTTRDAAGAETRVATHTFVPPEARGKGIAIALVEQMVADARARGFTIEPQCSYVEAAFRRHPEWADLRAETPG